MKIEQARWTENSGWSPFKPGGLSKDAQLAIIFGSTSIIKSQKYINEIRNAYPDVVIWGCSTSGEIFDTQVSEESLVATIVEFEKSSIRTVNKKIGSMSDSFNAGTYLADNLEKDGLKHVMVLSDGLKINGSDLVHGLAKNLPENIRITGGLAGDGDRFQETYVISGDKADKDMISVLGLYGDSINVGYGSLGGWDPFGPERLITKSSGNVLYELDHKSALDLYKKYLGDHAAGLPATGLLYPLSVRLNEGGPGVVRTILAVDEATQSMTFAGDVPEGSYGRLMKANFDRLIDGAHGAAQVCNDSLAAGKAQLAILISCVGRKMVLKQRVEEEVESVKEVLGAQVVQTGFYSYGEISPFTPNGKCELHNQTMTITTLSED